MTTAVEPRSGSPRRARLGALAGALVALAAAASLAVQAANVPALLDPGEDLTAGHAKGVVYGFVAATAALALAAALLPRRLLWAPPALAAAAAGAILLATLTVGGEAWSFALALLTMGACWRAGHAALRALRAPAAADAPAAAWLAGTTVLGLPILLLGRLDALRWWTVALPVIALGASAALPALRVLRRARAQPIELTRTGSASLAIVALLAGLASIFAAAPELMFDALYSKAWLPQHWAESGGIGSLEEHPQLAIMGFSPLLGVPGHLVDAEGVGRYVQLLSLVAAVAAVWWMARPSRWAPVAAAAIALTPHLFWQATTAYDDNVLMLGAIGLAAGVLAPFRERPRSALAAGIAVGLLAGACVNLKLHLAGVAVGLPLAWLVLREGAGRVRAAVGVAAGGLAVAAPPVVQRWIELGNPVLPTYNDIFKSDLWPVDDRQTYGFPIVDQEGDSPVVDLVVRTTTDTVAVHQASPDGAFGLLLAITALGVAIGWWRAGRDRGRLALWGGLPVASVWWFLQFRYLRFLAPIAVLASVALAWSPRAAPFGRLGDRAAVAAIAVTAALFVPSTMAQYWNVPDRDLPLDAALGLKDDYEYELASMPEREAVAVFDRLSPPGTMAVSEAPQRAWLSDGRDFSPGWEVAERMKAPAAPPATEPALDRLRELGVTWVVARQGDRPFNLPVVGPPVRQHSEVVWAGRGWLVARLTERPPSPRPLDPGAVRSERSGTSTAYTVPACPGQLLVADVRSTGRIDKKIPIDFDLGTPEAAMRIEVFASVPERLFATVPARARSATVTVQDVEGTTVSPLRFGVLGACG